MRRNVSGAAPGPMPGITSIEIASARHPDGTAIVFDRDYFGNPRSLSALPGPFADGEAAKGAL